MTGELRALYDGPKGIWTVEIRPKGKGAADVRASLKGAVVATLKVTVLDKLELPAASTEEGMLARLLIAENRGPGDPDFDAVAARTGMQWMRVVLANRLKNPGLYNAAGAKTLTDIVKAPGQVKGFGDYPVIATTQANLIAEIVRIANNDSDPRQDNYSRFVQDALDVAKSKTLIPDPCPTGLSGWRTDGSDPPGGLQVDFGQPLAGNQYFTLKP